MDIELNWDDFSPWQPGPEKGQRYMWAPEWWEFLGAGGANRPNDKELTEMFKNLGDDDS